MTFESVIISLLCIILMPRQGGRKWKLASTLFPASCDGCLVIFTIGVKT